MPACADAPVRRSLREMGYGVRMKSAAAASGPIPQDVARQVELLAAVARRTGNAVIVTDAQQRIEWVNDGFTRLTGYSSVDVIGRVPRDVLQGPDSDPVARARLLTVHHPAHAARVAWGH